MIDEADVTDVALSTLSYTSDQKNNISKRQFGSDHLEANGRAKILTAGF